MGLLLAAALALGLAALALQCRTKATARSDRRAACMAR